MKKFFRFFANLINMMMLTIAFGLWLLGIWGWFGQEVQKYVAIFTGVVLIWLCARFYKEVYIFMSNKDWDKVLKLR